MLFLLPMRKGSHTRWFHVNVTPYLTENKGRSLIGQWKGKAGLDVLEEREEGGEGGAARGDFGGRGGGRWSRTRYPGGAANSKES